MSADAVTRLRALLQEEGGLIATLLPRDGEIAAGPGPGPGAGSDASAGGGPEGNGAAGPAAIAAAGPRTRAQAAEYELLVEAIYEGYLLHYGTPRVVRSPEADLRLLAGDRLYAIGLARLVELGDTAAVAELADTITLSALAQGAGEHELAEAVWTAGAHAVGWGSSEAHRHAKELVLTGESGAIEAMRTSAEDSPASH